MVVLLAVCLGWAQQPSVPSASTANVAFEAFAADVESGAVDLKGKAAKAAGSKYQIDTSPAELLETWDRRKSCKSQCALLVDLAKGETDGIPKRDKLAPIEAHYAALLQPDASSTDLLSLTAQQDATEPFRAAAAYKAWAAMPDDKRWKIDGKYAQALMMDPEVAKTLKELSGDDEQLLAMQLDGVSAWTRWTVFHRKDDVTAIDRDALDQAFKEAERRELGLPGKERVVAVVLEERIGSPGASPMSGEELGYLAEHPGVQGTPLGVGLQVMRDVLVGEPDGESPEAVCALCEGDGRATGRPDLSHERVATAVQSVMPPHVTRTFLLPLGTVRLVGSVSSFPEYPNHRYVETSRLTLSLAEQELSVVLSHRRAKWVRFTGPAVFLAMGAFRHAMTGPTAQALADQLVAQ